MKKYLAIFVLFALIAGFAFADIPPAQTQIIRIKSVVEYATVDPVIRLVVSEIKSNASNSPFDASKLTDDGSGVEVFSIKDGGKVFFQAVLTNQSQTGESYSLSFGGGEFTDVVRNGKDGGTRAPSAIVTSIGTTIDDRNRGKGIKSIEFDSVTSASETNKPVIVRFQGILDTDTFSVDEGVVLATAEYDYPADSAIEGGTYFADVTLTVSAVR